MEDLTSILPAKRVNRRRSKPTLELPVSEQLVAGTTPQWRSLFQVFLDHLTIESRETGTTTLGKHLWGSQTRVLDFLAAGMDEGIRDFTILKSRQLGETTICLAIDLFWLFLYPGINGCILIDDEGNRDKIRVILRQFANGLPPKWRHRIVDDNKTLMSFNVGGKLSMLDFLYAGTRRSTLGASRSYRFAHMTEVANYGDPEGLENFIQTLSEGHPDRLFIKESTANHFNHFYHMCEQAKEDTHTQRFCFVGWWSRDDQRISSSDPRYNEYMEEPWTDEELELKEEVLRLYDVTVTDDQLCWYRWRSTARSIDEGMLHQTQPWTESQAFVLSGRSFFPLRRVEADIKEIYQAAPAQDSPYDFTAYRYYLGQDLPSTTIEEVHTIDEADLKVWEDPVPWGRYVIGVDPAYGRSDWNDSHAITVCRCYADRLVTVAEYGTPEPETFQVTWALAHLAALYDDCYINIEVKGPGVVIMNELRRLKVWLQSQMMATIVHDKDWHNITDNAKWYLWHRPDSLGKGYAYGVNTTYDLKIAIMNELRDSYINHALWIKSLRCLKQMQFVVQEGADIGPGAKGRNHDDYVFSLAFAHRAWQDWVRQDLIDLGYTWARAQQDDLDRKTGRPPNAVASIVANFFANKERDRTEGPPEQAWYRERGL
jgi:hypothetical protein